MPFARKRRTSSSILSTVSMIGEVSSSCDPMWQLTPSSWILVSDRARWYTASAAAMSTPNLSMEPT